MADQGTSYVIGIWVAALLTLIGYSFLYKDNPAYRFAESLFVGVSAGYGLAIAYRMYIVPDLWTPIVDEGQLSRLIPAGLGMLMLCRFHPKISWLSRWPMAFTIGLGAGMTIPATLQARVLEQAKPTMVSPIVMSEGTVLANVMTSLSHCVLILGVLAVLAYFFFSKEHKGNYGRFCKLGIYFLMFSFGASFGYTVMARVSLFIGRVTFLLRDWLHAI
jgi:hypothetical protein